MDYIYNPLTNRKVSINGKTGKKILKNYINSYIFNGGSMSDLKNCTISNINCSNKKYPCYNSNNLTCCNRDTLKCIKSNFHPDNLYGNCVKDRINCNKKKFPCYNYKKNTCCSINRKNCVKGNFHPDNLYGPCIKDSINCSNKNYPCYEHKMNNCCSKDKKKCIKGNFNL